MLLDILGALTSLLSTYYFIRLNWKAWPVTLLATCLNGFLYGQKGIYADMLLELLYFLFTCYGWYLWQPTKQSRPILLKLSIKHWTLLIVFTATLYLIIATLLSRFTHSNVVVMDSLTTSLSLAAQWLMCRKVITTWFFWFFIDLIYAYMYLYKQLVFHCLLMLFYTGMAVVGYLTWSKKQRLTEFVQQDIAI